MMHETKTQALAAARAFKRKFDLPRSWKVEVRYRSDLLQWSWRIVGSEFHVEQVTRRVVKMTTGKVWRPKLVITHGPTGRFIYGMAFRATLKRLRPMVDTFLSQQRQLIEKDILSNKAWLASVQEQQKAAAKAFAAV